MKTKQRTVRLVICVLLALGILGVSAVTVINSVVKLTTKPQILTSQEAATLDADCILVLGCYVMDNGNPSAMLHDRLQRGVELYELGAAPKLLMSGDHGRQNYDEVDAMKQFAVDAGIASEDVFMDHAGFSTYESIYRAKEIFQAKRIIIVSQEYHLYRAIYIAERFGLEAYGVNADYRSYIGQTSRDIREILARVKDFTICIFKPEPTFLGEAIPIFGDGNLTNDASSDFS
ncbi:MAG: YdcF family protein [Oscillospiraceae bacterium]|nr:YdcF family protein [Oscillospiraceae bacterium]